MSKPSSRSAASGVAFRALLCLASTVWAGCASDEPGISPPRDRLYFPSALSLTHWAEPATGEVMRDRPLLLVANANADLRYNGATIMVLDLTDLPDELERLGQVEALSCSRDPFAPSRWECPEERFIQQGATLRIGDFPSALAVSPRVGPSGSRRLFVTVRGGGALTWAELVGLQDGGVDLRCDDDIPSEGGCRDLGNDRNCEQWDCDDEHNVRYSDAIERELPAEPFALALNALRAVHVFPDGTRRTCADGLPSPPPCDCGQVRACAESGANAEGGEGPCCTPAPKLGAMEIDEIYVSHLDAGEVSLFRSDDLGVSLLDVRGGFFESGGTVAGGAFSLAVQRPGDERTRVYASSREDDDLATFVVQGSPGGGPQIVRSVSTPIGAIRPPASGSFDLRGLAIAPGGSRVFAVSRVPNSLVAMDVIEEAGVVRHEPAWAVEVCSDPSLVVLGPHERDPAAHYAYVVCFAEAALFVIDTRLGALVGRIETGRGPNGLVLDVGSQQSCEGRRPCSDDHESCLAGRCVKATPRAFVANFLENTIGVIDLRPASPSYRRMVARIGRATNVVEQ